MMRKTFDVAVLGLGAHGSAAAAHLARRGRSVIGLEQHGPSHDRGSSHGRTRIIRLAYAEGAGYVPLLRRAYELWSELERESGARLFVETGGLMIGREGGAIVGGAIASARAHSIPHRVFTARELRAVQPAFHLREGDVAMLDERAGVLFPEDCIRAHHQLAVRAGAELRFGARARFARDVASLGDGAVALEVNGATIEAERVVVAAGAWTSLVAGSAAPPLAVDRQVVHWFEPKLDARAFEADRFPIFIWDLGEGHALPAGVGAFYGIPRLRGDGVKVAFHGAREATEPDRLRRDVAPDEVARMRDVLDRTMPDVAGRHLGSSACIYTSTRDEHFAIGLVARGRVALASPCSGHGFKFASVVGEILADLIIDGRTRHPIEPFALDRPALSR